jgi:hypothetical protein
MHDGTHSRGSATLLVACLSAGMALTMAAGVALMTHHPTDTATTPAPAADAPVARTVAPSTAPTVRVHARQDGVAVTTAFPHTTELPTPHRVAVRARHTVGSVRASRPAPRPHRAGRHARAPRPSRTTCAWPGERHWRHWQQWVQWQNVRDACRH